MHIPLLLERHPLRECFNKNVRVKHNMQRQSITRHVPGAAEPPKPSGHVQFRSSCGHYTTPTQFNSHAAFEHVLPPVEPRVYGESFVPGDRPRAGIEHRVFPASHSCL